MRSHLSRWLERCRLTFCIPENRASMKSSKPKRATISSDTSITGYENIYFVRKGASNSAVFNGILHSDVLVKK